MFFISLYCPTAGQGSSPSSRSSFPAPRRLINTQPLTHYLSLRSLASLHLSELVSAARSVFNYPLCECCCPAFILDSADMIRSIQFEPESLLSYINYIHFGTLRGVPNSVTSAKCIVSKYFDTSHRWSHIWLKKMTV